ncbi:MAG: NAD(P)H-quinone dehydrogenase [Ancrocorticia sp.]|uniref:NAD(P)H-quinone dehydrogenase n=1 Tax=Ancrocorticia sp. TaxID=2593684 RepID=UPI003F91816D
MSAHDPVTPESPEATSSPSFTQHSGHDNASPVRAGAQVAIIGGGPGGYEAATVAARMGAQVTLIETRGLGGSAVLTDVVPSKTLIATAEQAQETSEASELGIATSVVSIDMTQVNGRVRHLAQSQSSDIRDSLENLGVQVISGRARLKPGIDDRGRRTISVALPDEDAFNLELSADIVLLATGASPRELPSAKPDGHRIFTWAQLYNLEELPEHLIVVGSGVTGAEFASAYRGLGAKVTLVSSRDRILPGEDTDAAEIIERVFVERGMQIERRSRALSATATDDGVEVTLNDGRTIHGSHCLMAVGAVPNTQDLVLAEAGVETTDTDHIRVDRVSRTTSYRVYAAGDCTGVLPLASVAAQQGRIAMWHALGDSLDPMDADAVARAVFTSPEVAAVGVSEEAARKAGYKVRVAKLPLARNPRAKMQSVDEGFVKIISSRSGIVKGGVVVGPHASDLIFPLTLAVHSRMTVDQLSSASTIYPSISGTISEVARMLH